MVENSNTPKDIKFEDLNDYESALHDFEWKIHVSRKVIEIFPKFNNQYKEELSQEFGTLFKTLTPEQRQHVIDFKNQLTNKLDNIKQFPASVSGKVTIPSKKTAEAIGKLMDSVQLTDATEEFVNETSLVYLITIFEEFLKNVLTSVFVNNPSVLRSNKEMTHKDILLCSDFDEVKQKIIEKEIEDTINKDIEKLGQHLSEYFKLDLQQYDEWTKFIECFYRRHVIVHNNSKPDLKYRLKTRQDLTTLKTNQEYMFTSMDIFHKYAKIIHTFFSEKYPIKQ